MTPETFKSSKYCNSRLKRGIDVAAGIFLSPFAAIAVIGVGIAIKLDDGGEIFFTQQRIGKNGRVFEIYKLRTKKSNGETTKIGNIVRPFGIDELPQVINFLRGDMSLYGIRALMIDDFEAVCKFNEKYPDIFDEDFVREWSTSYLSSRPGGLSLAAAMADSVLYRGYGDIYGIKRKMEHDILQAKTETPILDSQILLTIIGRAISEKLNLKKIKSFR